MKKRPRPSTTTATTKQGAAQGSKNVQKKSGCGCGKKRGG